MTNHDDMGGQYFALLCRQRSSRGWFPGAVSSEEDSVSPCLTSLVRDCQIQPVNLLCFLEFNTLPALDSVLPYVTSLAHDGQKDWTFYV